MVGCMIEMYTPLDEHNSTTLGASGLCSNVVYEDDKLIHGRIRHSFLPSEPSSSINGVRPKVGCYIVNPSHLSASSGSEQLGGKGRCRC